jgi:hypothetical protein
MERGSRTGQNDSPSIRGTGGHTLSLSARCKGKRGLYQSTERKGPQGSALVSAFSTRETGLVTVEIC